MYSAIAANKRNTFLIVGGFIALLGGISIWWGQATGNGSSAIFILGFIVVYALFQYFVASSIAVAMSGAVPIEKADNPRLWRIVENLSITEGMPMPKVYVIQMKRPMHLLPAVIQSTQLWRLPPVCWPSWMTKSSRA